MAYNLSSRFPHLLDESVDPCAYYISSCIQASKENSVPFLSRHPRNTFLGGRIYTDKIYDAEKSHHIPGGKQDKSPRFKFTTTDGSAIGDDDQENVCKCGLVPCECYLDNETFKEVCQGALPRKLYKGHVPLTFLGGGMSMPPRGHKGYSLLPDGRQQSIPRVLHVGGPDFYDTRVNESTAFYRGCKWSQWTTRRADRQREATPGPADYQHEHVPSDYELCMDRYRFLKRHNTRQLRYMEMVQLRNILQAGPGPSDYCPKLLICNAVAKLGPRAARFPEPGLEVRPGPADHNIDKPMCKGLCYVKPWRFISRAPFGVKAERFHKSSQNNPGPGQYSPRIKKTMRDKFCNLAAFGSSDKRFKSDPESEEDDDISEDCPDIEKEECVLNTSSFKSKTRRFKPLIKQPNSPSPADLILPSKKFVKRTAAIQRLSPFQSSEGRFKPWHDWMPVHGTVVTSGPGLYDIARRPQCFPGGLKIPRASRFARVKNDGPAPNAYSIDRGIETVRHTFNQRLLKSVNKKDTFKWKPLVMVPKSIRSREADLLAKSIFDLNTDPDIKEFKPKKDERDIESELKDVNRKPRVPGEPLLLKHFLYNHQVEPC